MGECDEAWQPLLEADDELREALADSTALTRPSLDRAESLFIDRLARVTEIWGHLEPTHAEYQTLLRELYAVENDIRKILQLAQLVIDNWDKAQRELTKGRPGAFAAVTSTLIRLAYKKAVD